MASASANLPRINAILLLLVAPVALRFWIEAVIWRLQRGPQMLGFSLAHGGAGWMTVPLILSFLAIWIYALWVALVIVLWVIPASRPRMAKPQHAALGGASLFGFLQIADLLQRDMSIGFLLAGAAGMTALGCVMGWLIYAGLHSEQSAGGA